MRAPFDVPEDKKYRDKFLKKITITLTKETKSSNRDSETELSNNNQIHYIYITQRRYCKRTLDSDYD